MCTVVIFSDNDKTTITMNRDERLEREAETAPELWDNPKITAPIDPKSGGTWIGHNEGGDWACLLNGYLTTEATIAAPKSRGLIIPEILNSKTPNEYLDNADLSNIHSFCLLLGCGGDIIEYFWDGSSLQKNILTKQTWQFFTSSSLEQPLVTAYRKKAFATWEQDGAALNEEGIPKINLFCEDGREDYGVMMQRSYSETKSISQIIISDKQPAYMNYWNANNFR